MTYKLFMAGYAAGGANQLEVVGFLRDSTGPYSASYQTSISPSLTDTAATIATAAETALIALLVSDGLPTPDSVIWVINTVPDDPSFSNPTRSLNSAFQISTTNKALVSYAVSISCSLSLTTGQEGTVYLEYADDSGFTTNVVQVGASVNGNTGTLVIGLSLTQLATATLSGVIPAGKYVRLRTANNTGTPTFAFVSAQEVLA